MFYFHKRKSGRETINQRLQSLPINQELLHAEVQSARSPAPVTCVRDGPRHRRRRRNGRNKKGPDNKCPVFAANSSELTQKGTFSKSRDAADSRVLCIQINIGTILRIIPTSIMKNDSIQSLETASAGPASARRQFLKTAGATLLGAAALSEQVHGKAIFQDLHVTTYTGGVVFNRELPGLAGQLIMNVYLAVEPDGTGLGTLGDPLHPAVNAHLAVEETIRQGNQVQFTGVILGANDQSQIGQPFVVAGEVHQDFTLLTLEINGTTFNGKGFFVSSPKLAMADASVR